MTSTVQRPIRVFLFLCCCFSFHSFVIARIFLFRQHDVTFCIINQIQRMTKSFIYLFTLVGKTGWYAWYLRKKKSRGHSFICSLYTDVLYIWKTFLLLVFYKKFYLLRKDLKDQSWIIFHKFKFIHTILLQQMNNFDNDFKICLLPGKIFLFPRKFL